MPEETHKELLKEILQAQQNNAITLKENAKRQLSFAADVSNFMNKQYIHNDRIKGYLENDPATNQVGLVEEVSKIKTDLTTFKATMNKKSYIYGTGAAGVVMALKWIIAKVII